MREANTCIVYISLSQIRSRHLNLALACLLKLCNSRWIICMMNMYIRVINNRQQAIKQQTGSAGSIKASHLSWMECNKSGCIDEKKYIGGSFQLK